MIGDCGHEVDPSRGFHTADDTDVCEECCTQCTAERELMAELHGLRVERARLRWVLAVAGYQLGEWSEDGERHVDDVPAGDCTRCGDVEDGDWSPECAALNEWRPALLRDERGHGWSFVAWLPADEVLMDLDRQVRGKTDG